MANQRPINRRPWRKKPWGKKRPTRWNAAFTGYTPEVGAGIEGVNVLNVGASPLVPPIFTLVSGQVDVEPWADEQEVTLDRLVGTLSFKAQWDVGAGAAGPYLRVGILLHEEVSQGVDLPELNLFEQETWEDYEWLWLWSGTMPIIVTSNNGDTLVALKEFELDIKNRRKIGQSDELVVYAQSADGDGWALSTVIAVQAIRTILMSR